MAAVPRDLACAICCEEKPALCALSKCSHQSCRNCFVQWIGKVESTGQMDLPGCPFCRVEMAPQDIVAIAGRPYSPKVASSPGSSMEEMDELTRQWLEQQTIPCLGCGARIQKNDGCNLMECLCGYRFCYACGSQGALCSCTPATHTFWDNILEESAPRRPPEVASTNLETGQMDLKEYMEKRKQERRQSSDDLMVLLTMASNCPAYPVYTPTTSPMYSPTTPPYDPNWSQERPSTPGPDLESGYYGSAPGGAATNPPPWGQPHAPPPVQFNPDIYPTSSTAFQLTSLPWSCPSPQYSETSATFSPPASPQRRMHHDPDMYLPSPQYSVTSATFSPSRDVTMMDPAGSSLVAVGPMVYCPPLPDLNNSTNKISSSLS